ncbi:restriction endonuclease [Streptomyces sp. NPDC053048]|uniref:restriction endonuclease n=1 Tax=Streptomyces sp. NPDC053048 TaxID=3365694 RepID=UPI0037CFF775
MIPGRARPGGRPRLPRTPAETTAAVVALVFLAFIVRRLLALLAGPVAYGWLPTCLVIGCGWPLAARARRWYRARRLRGTEPLALSLRDVDALSPGQFELAVRDLMIRDGIAARHVGRRGDQAADVIGTDRTGRVFVAQCKHTAIGGRVGSHVMYEVKGTAGPVHGADVAVVVTNGGFTRDARAWGERHGIHCVDRERLAEWARGGRSLDALLGLRGHLGFGLGDGSGDH